MWKVLRLLIATNPMGMFLWGIIAKWYLLIAIPLLVITFWTMKGFEQIGLLNFITTETVKILATTKAIAQNCIPTLGARGVDSTSQNLQNFWTCVGDPPAYDVNKKFKIDENSTTEKEKTTQEKHLQEQLEKGLKTLSPEGNIPADFPYMEHPPYPTNPYEQEPLPSP